MNDSNDSNIADALMMELGEPSEKKNGKMNDIVQKGGRGSSSNHSF